MRRLFSAIALLCALVSPALSAGSIPIALSQQFNANGQPLISCQLYLYQVGTVATPQTAYQDTGLSQALPWPVTCDSNGRLPMFYLADGSVHPRLTDSAGVVQFDYPSMLVIGPSSGGGGGSTVDPTAIASTGDIKFRPTSEALAGWTKLNGQTIGSASSGASGRANADTLNLFTYFWQNCTDAHCPVLTGRGASAAADFAANKQLTVPDWRARIPVGLDDMGNTPAGILKTVNMAGSDTVTTPGGLGGQAVHSLAMPELPASPAPFNGTVLPTLNGNQVALAVPNGTTGSGFSGAPGGARVLSPADLQVFDTKSISNSANLGSGTALNVMNTFALGTWYCKL